MLVGLSGTPGTGKSTISSLLQNAGYTIIDLNEIVINQDFVIGTDKERDSKIVDIEKLNDYIKKNFKKKSGFIIADGHISHLLKTVDKVIILRCHPKKLKIRLEKKGWNNSKINENIEAEILDIILCETIEIHSEDSIFEIDTSDKNINSVFLSILEIFKSNFLQIKKYKIGKIDWSEEIFNKY